MKQKLLSLIGSFNFETKCIPASRLFLRRMIGLSWKVKLLFHYITLRQTSDVTLRGAGVLATWEQHRQVFGRVWVTAES